MCYTSFRDSGALCKLLPLQQRITDLSLWVSWSRTLTQCGQTRHVISFLLALHTFPWLAGKSPLVPGLTFQLLCICLTIGQILYHPITFFGTGLQGRQYLWENLRSLAVPSDMLWDETVCLPAIQKGHIQTDIWLKTTKTTLLSPVSACPYQMQQHCTLRDTDAPRLTMLFCLQYEHAPRATAAHNITSFAVIAF